MLKHKHLQCDLSENIKTVNIMSYFNPPFLMISIDFDQV